VGLRCTQNPTMGEEWRRGWHPERIAVHPKRERALVIGGGPAGLEAAFTLGRRGLEVALAEASDQFGGRLLREATLPGLATWMRVRDWRLHMIGKLPNVELFPSSRMSAVDVAEFGADHVVLATGSHWRRDAVGVYAIRPGEFPAALTPDDVFTGATVSGPVVIYDDEHYFMAGALAEKLAAVGHEVHYVTTASVASSWTVMTNEQDFLQARLIEAGVSIHPLKALKAQGKGEVTLSCVYTGRDVPLPCGTLILCTGRLPDTAVNEDLSVQGFVAARIGDCLTPSSIADAVHSAHRYARLLGEPDLPPRRERAPHRSP
jgi:dimethylamine/trimethylamine dehydrogenase